MSGFSLDDIFSTDALERNNVKKKKKHLLMVIRIFFRELNKRPTDYYTFDHHISAEKGCNLSIINHAIADKVNKTTLTLFKS